MINQTSLADPEVPIGGTLRETLGWEASVPPHGTATHVFTHLVFIGVGTTMETILANSFDPSIFGVWASTMPVVSGSYSYDLDMFIPEGVPLGTYSVLTIICEDFDGATITGIWDYKVDLNVLTVVQGLGASIISTSFISA